MSLLESEEAALERTVIRPRVKPASFLTRRGLIKVPEITLLFWVIKLLTTALGESTSDYLVHALDPIVAVMLGAAGFAVAMALQFAVKRYIAAVYWFAVVMVAIFGTMAADVVHIVLGVPYVDSVIGFAIALGIIFAVWQRVEGTLSIHSIHSVRREAFYWLTVITTFALGTAAGDMTAATWRLGYFPSALLFMALFALPALGYAFFRLNAIAAFWVAYILTRPIGASYADWLGRAPNAGGVGVGTGPVSAVLTVAIIALVGYLTVTRHDVQKG